MSFILRWLDYLLARMALHTTAFVRNSSEDRKKVIDRMKFITDRLQSIEREQGTRKTAAVAPPKDDRQNC